MELVGFLSLCFSAAARSADEIEAFFLLRSESIFAASEHKTLILLKLRVCQVFYFERKSAIYLLTWRSYIGHKFQYKLNKVTYSPSTKKMK